MPREGDDSGEEDEEGSENDDEKEGEEVGQEAQPHKEPQGEQEPAPQPPPQPQYPYFEMGGSSSTFYMPFDNSFLQSFANLQMEVTEFREGYTGMR